MGCAVGAVVGSGGWEACAPRRHSAACPVDGVAAKSYWREHGLEGYGRTRSAIMVRRTRMPSRRAFRLLVPLRRSYS